MPKRSVLMRGKPRGARSLKIHINGSGVTRTLPSCEYPRMEASRVPRARSTRRKLESVWAPPFPSPEEGWGENCYCLAQPLPRQQCWLDQPTEHKSSQIFLNGKDQRLKNLKKKKKQSKKIAMKLPCVSPSVSTSAQAGLTTEA